MSKHLSPHDSQGTKRRGCERERHFAGSMCVHTPQLRKALYSHPSLRETPEHLPHGKPEGAGSEPFTGSDRQLGDKIRA